MKKVKLGDICEIVSGSTPKTGIASLWDGDIDWITPAELSDDTYILTESKRKITKEGVAKTGLKPFPEGTVILSSRAPIGKVAIAGKRMYCNQGFKNLICSESIENTYLYWFFKGNTKYLNSLGRGATFKEISKPIVENIIINLPSKDEQKREADILKQCWDITNLKKHQLEMLDDLIKSRFVELFGSIYDGKFEMKTLPEIVCDDKNAIKRGPFGGALKKDDFVEEGYLVYEQRHAIHSDFEYAKYYITQEKYEDMIGFKVEPGDLLISCSGVTLGRIAEVPGGAKKGIINQALMKLSLNQDIMMNTFFIQQFRTEEIQDILFGFSRGSGIPNMPSMGEVKSVKFICPPLESQKQYCEFVKQVDKSKSNLPNKRKASWYIMDYNKRDAA